MPDTAQLSALLTGYLRELDHRRTEVDHLRRQVVPAAPTGMTAELATLLDAVELSVRRGDVAARRLLRRLQSSN